MGYTLFKLNYSFYPQTFYNKIVNHRSQLKLVKEITNELKELINIYNKNFLYIKKLQIQYHNEYAKLRSYTLGEKV